MKMGIFCSGVLWGSFFVLLGLSIILKSTLNIDIPVVRLFLAAFLIYLGVRVIAGGFWGGRACGPNAVFDEAKVAASAKAREYNVVFGNGVIDLTGVEVKDRDVFLQANTVFGASTVRLKAGVPALVKANSAFADLRFPDGNAAVLGSYLYKGKNYAEGKPHLELELNTVFGQTRVEEVD